MISMTPILPAMMLAASCLRVSVSTPRTCSCSNSSLCFGLYLLNYADADKAIVISIAITVISVSNHRIIAMAATVRITVEVAASTTSSTT